jgi:starch-binding outer membrane protein, SusD/RagB family
MFFGATTMLLQACSKKDLVDLTPEFSLDALSNPSSIKQVEEVLLGAYAGFRSANYYGSGSGSGSGWSMMPDVLSDNFYETQQTLGNSRDMADWTYLPNTAQIGALYSSPYVVIASANIVLRDIDKFTTAANQLQANRIKGQAHAIRALAHFDLFRYFAANYDRNSTTVLALAYTKEFKVSPSLKPARISNKAFYDEMFADLSAAVTLLGNVDKTINPSAAVTRPFIDRAGAYAIQARAFLYAGMWPEAVTAATNAINLRPLPALNQTGFSGMYNQTAVGDMIWNVQFESGQSGPTFIAYFATVNRSYFRPAPEVAVSAGNAGLIQSNDIRFNAFFTIDAADALGRLAITKYRGKGAGVSDGNMNFMALRTGEVYLIRAEAHARIGGANTALGMADLNTLRAARINGYVNEALIGSALLDAIANERRRELFAEGHRFFDLKRTTRTITRGVVCGNFTLSPSGSCTLNSTAKEWALPIPEGIMNANQNMVQNPGYN